jgi:flavin reductase (DIM6/NTAB) family NADH-FMN oxidoreductase RutF
VPVDPDLFRGTLASWASGVTVVTSRLGDDIRGMTASAFCSLSLDPPLVLVCVDKSAIMHDFMAKSQIFAINVLAREQEDVSRACASRRVEESRRLEGIPYHEESTGSPILDHAIAYLDRVEAAGARDGEPLLYFRSAYRSIAQD